MLKIGIIGCGRIADQHVAEILKIPECCIVGVCDKELLMAKQLQERTKSGAYFDEVDKLLELKPHVVHITTPPQSHFELGKKCLEAGSNIFVEKPFALSSHETDELINLAEKLSLKITVGHNIQFSNAAIQLRKMVNEGQLGGNPVHIESLWCHEHGSDYLYDKSHWIRRLKGSIVHDLISHGVGIIGELMEGDDPEVSAHGFISPILKKHNITDTIDELRVHIYNRNNTTATYIFSSQIKPIIKEFRIYGLKNSFVLDHEHQTLIKFTANYKHYANHFIPSLINAKQYAGNFIFNASQFIKRKHYYEAGRLNLITSFYNSVSKGTPLPMSVKEIKRTYLIIDKIFKQLYS